MQINSCVFDRNSNGVLTEELIKIIKNSFRIICYQIAKGNYIDKKWKDIEIIHNFKDFLAQYRKSIGQLYEVGLLDLLDIRYYKYNEILDGEFDSITIIFLNKDLDKIYTFNTNNLED